MYAKRLVKEKALLAGYFPCSNGNNIIDWDSVHFAASVFKDRQVAIGNRASCPWQQHKLKVKTWGHQIFVTPCSSDNPVCSAQETFEIKFCHLLSKSYRLSSLTWHYLNFVLVPDLSFQWRMREVKRNPWTSYVITAISRVIKPQAARPIHIKKTLRLAVHTVHLIS